MKIANAAHIRVLKECLNDLEFPCWGMSSQTQHFLLFHYCRSSTWLSWGVGQLGEFCFSSYFSGITHTRNSSSLLWKLLYTQGPRFWISLQSKMKIGLDSPNCSLPKPRTISSHHVGATCLLPTQLSSLAAAVRSSCPGRQTAWGSPGASQQHSAGWERGLGLGKQKVMDFQEGEGKNSNGWGAVDSVLQWDKHNNSREKTSKVPY